MGQIIKRLRKERGFTQEELAEQIGVTFQAVSKWENDTGMPDISQVIPLATVFDVSTDVLFGLYGTNNTEEVNRIIEEAYAFLSYPVTKEKVRKKYDRLHEGLELYPSNTLLMMNCLEAGMALAYPSNDTYDQENGEAIYHKCISEANLVIKYGKNTTDVLRAHMIMVLLHAAYGQIEEARSHADIFPYRADMTVNEMRGYIARWEKNYEEESGYWQTDFMYHFEALLDDIVDIGMCYFNCEKYGIAAECFRQALSMIDLVCKDEDIVPSFHKREAGDIHFLLARAYLKTEQREKAIPELQKAAQYDTKETKRFVSGQKMISPLLHDADFDFYRNDMNYKTALLKSLNDSFFDEIRKTKEFQDILKTVNEM